MAPLPITLTLPESYELVELADGTQFPRHVDLLVQEAGTVGPIFEITFDVEDGKPALSRFAVVRAPGDPPLSPKTIREISVGAIVESARYHTAAGVLAFSRSGPFGAQRSHDPVTEMRFAGEQAGEVGQRRIVTDRLLQQVAMIYQANETGAPTKAVADMLYTSHRNATRWVALARGRGLLPPYGSLDDVDKGV